MNMRSVEYVQTLKPIDMPDGYEVLNSGRAIGNKIEMNKNKFLEKSGYPTYLDYKKDMMRQGKPIWLILLGLATLEEQVDGIKKIYEFSQRTGLQIDTILNIPSFLVALPKEYRDKAPKPTSYVMETLEDYEAHCCVPMQILFCDQVLSCPNSLETTINAVKCGSARVGFLSQFIWGQPGFTDHRQHVIDLVKSIGIVSSKTDQGIGVDTYLDDGFPGYAMDCVTYVGYALLDHYIVHELCGADHQIAYGGLLSEGIPRCAVGLALHKLLSTEDHPIISYFNSSTVEQWDHDIVANYGPSLQEILLESLMNKKYGMCGTINPVSITEKVEVPTLQDLLDIFSAGAKMLTHLEDWEGLMDWTKLEEMADFLVEEGKLFFENTLAVCEAAGINTKDPLEMLMMLKSLNPSKFEATFHHRTDEAGMVQVQVPTVLGRQTLAMKDDVKEDLLKRGIATDALKGKRVVVVSGDGHAYGVVLVENLLSELGAEVVNGGVDIVPSVALDLADEEGIDYIGISVHIGQGLDYAKQIKELADLRNKDYKIFMGGKLNAILPGDSEPSDVTELINETGILAADDIYDAIQMMM